MDAAFWIVYAFIIGLLFGSFGNVVIYRIPRGVSIVFPPSKCTVCGLRLTAVDLVPIISWLFLRGRCRYCDVRISVRYPLVELACGVLFACITFVTTSFSAVFACFLAFLLLCVIMMEIDGKTMPTGLIFAAMFAGIAWTASGFFLPYTFPVAPSWQAMSVGIAFNNLFLIAKPQRRFLRFLLIGLVYWLLGLGTIILHIF
ncbi:MAG: prepilin peptidase [Defluviitaleaceae bacterium]|nr:prepilin peptidase [Defluviitaleaceae bacterium]MCL2274941.1 prepilin peptidase [Defluviitaleaceae bacterium]